MSKKNYKKTPYHIRKNSKAIVANSLIKCSKALAMIDAISTSELLDFTDAGSEGHTFQDGKDIGRKEFASMVKEIISREVGE